MAGTVNGGKRAAATNIKKHGKDFYARIGAQGGKAGTTGGFAAKVMCDCPLFEEAHHNARCSGLKGGLKSRRVKKTSN